MGARIFQNMKNSNYNAFRSICQFVSRQNVIQTDEPMNIIKKIIFSDDTGSLLPPEHSAWTTLKVEKVRFNLIKIFSVANTKTLAWI